MTCISFPSAPDAVKDAVEADTLVADDWGDGVEAVCVMSAIVRGAQSVEDCVTAGWPEWLTRAVINLFDAKSRSGREQEDRCEFALALAIAVSRPFDHLKARDLYLLKGLPRDLDWMRREHRADRRFHAVEAVLVKAIDILKRRANGEDVDAAALLAEKEASEARGGGDSPYVTILSNTADAVRLALKKTSPIYAGVGDAANSRRHLIEAITEASITETYSTVTEE